MDNRNKHAAIKFLKSKIEGQTEGLHKVSINADESKILKSVSNVVRSKAGINTVKMSEDSYKLFIDIQKFNHYLQNLNESQSTVATNDDKQHIPSNNDSANNNKRKNLEGTIGEKKQKSDSEYRFSDLIKFISDKIKKRKPTKARLYINITPDQVAFVTRLPQKTKTRAGIKLRSQQSIEVDVNIFNDYLKQPSNRSTTSSTTSEQLSVQAETQTDTKNALESFNNINLSSALDYASSDAAADLQQEPLLEEPPRPSIVDHSSSTSVSSFYGSLFSKENQENELCLLGLDEFEKSINSDQPNQVQQNLNEANISTATNVSEQQEVYASSSFLDSMFYYSGVSFQLDDDKLEAQKTITPPGSPN